MRVVVSCLDHAGRSSYIQEHHTIPSVEEDDKQRTGRSAQSTPVHPRSARRNQHRQWRLQTQRTLREGSLFGGLEFGVRWTVRGSWMGSLGSLSPINGLVQSPNRVPYRPNPSRYSSRVLTHGMYRLEPIHPIQPSHPLPSRLLYTNLLPNIRSMQSHLHPCPTTAR